MPRNMSFMLTTQQMYDKIKTHTIRDGWWFLKPGDIVNAVEQAQGLKKGERVVSICRIRIKWTWEDMLINVTPELCIMEGFPGLTPVEFADMFCLLNRKASLTKPLNFIGFEYVEENLGIEQPGQEAFDMDEKLCIGLSVCGGPCDNSCLAVRAGVEG